tara:strand:- start:3420 stop:3686 length:267 start_codon:yes stop_codon:yes gene_type:complete
MLKEVRFDFCPKCGGKLERFNPTEYLVGTANVKRECEWAKCVLCFYIFGLMERVPYGYWSSYKGAGTVEFGLFSIERRIMTYENLLEE